MGSKGSRDLLESEPLLGSRAPEDAVDGSNIIHGRILPCYT